VTESRREIDRDQVAIGCQVTLARRMMMASVGYLTRGMMQAAQS
jgi:hypothetical protein